MLVNVTSGLLGKTRLQCLHINVSGRSSQAPGGTSPSPLEVSPRGRISPAQTQQMGLPGGRNNANIKQNNVEVIGFEKGRPLFF